MGTCKYLVFGFGSCPLFLKYKRRWVQVSLGFRLAHGLSRARIYFRTRTLVAVVASAWETKVPIFSTHRSRSWRDRSCGTKRQGAEGTEERCACHGVPLFSNIHGVLDGTRNHGRSWNCWHSLLRYEMGSGRRQKHQPGKTRQTYTYQTRTYYQ